VSRAGRDRDPVLDSGVVTDLRNQLQQSLGEAYRLERELGGGGMSRVFLAQETALGRQVVVKVLLPELAASVSVDRFRREIQLAAQLSHPHIVPLLAAGNTGGLPWFTMPYVTGESLRNRLLRDGELPVVDTIRILRDVASALAYAHAQAVVHRDIKPDNVLLSHGVAVVTDFGVAKALTASADQVLHSGLTSMGVTLGTPAYMAPEQASADPGLDHRVDVYAYGIMAYEMLTGQTPFHGRSPSAMLGAHMAAIPEPITTRRPGIPPLLAHLVMKCLEKRPADRPQTASDLIATIDMLTTPSGGTVPLRAVPSGSAETLVTGSLGRGSAGTQERESAGWRRVGFPAAALIVAAGAVVWAVRSGRSRENAAPETPTAVPAPALAPVVAPASETATASDQPDTSSASTGTPSVRPSTRPTVRPSAPRNPDESALLARLRSEALAARTRAAAAGASEEALARGDAALATGDSLRAGRKTVAAAARFSSATTLWSDAADAAERASSTAESAATAAAAPSLPAAPAPTPPAASAPAPSSPAPPRPSAPVPPADPAPAIRNLFTEYAQAIESRSIPAIRRVYPGLSAAQSKEWEDFFGAVDAIDVDLQVSELAVSGDSADARLSGVYVFQNPGNRRTQREPVSFQARLRRMGGEWRIEVLR
jgi:serine/threonine protein kinase